MDGSFSNSSSDIQPDGREARIFLQARLCRGIVLDDARDLVIRRVHHRFQFAAEVTMPRSEHSGPNFRDGRVRRHRGQKFALVFEETYAGPSRASFLRIPDGRADEALRMFLGVVVINGDHFAVLALDAARIAEVPTSAVLPQDDFIAPGSPVIDC